MTTEPHRLHHAKIRVYAGAGLARDRVLHHGATTTAETHTAMSDARIPAEAGTGGLRRPNMAFEVREILPWATVPTTERQRPFE